MKRRGPPGRPKLAAALGLVTATGLALKQLPAAAGSWPGNHGAGVAYVVFWILLVLLLRPTLAISRVAAGVLLVTCGLELLQLWHPPLLEALRGSFLGQALIGSTFSPWDFPHYAAGGLLGAALAQRLGGRREADRYPA